MFLTYIWLAFGDTSSEASLTSYLANKDVIKAMIVSTTMISKAKQATYDPAIIEVDGM